MGYCPTKEHAKPVTLTDYQNWLSGIGIYARDSDWGNHTHEKALKYFKLIWVGIDMENGMVFSIKTDNPMLCAEAGEDFSGTILDKLNIAIIELKQKR